LQNSNSSSVEVQLTSYPMLKVDSNQFHNCILYPQYHCITFDASMKVCICWHSQGGCMAENTSKRFFI